MRFHVKADFECEQEKHSPPFLPKYSFGLFFFFSLEGLREFCLLCTVASAAKADEKESKNVTFALIAHRPEALSVMRMLFISLCSNSANQNVLC